MMKSILLIAAIGVALVASQPIRPQFSETFEGEGYAHLTNQNGSFWAIGHWAVDQPKGMGIERWEFAEHERHHNVLLLQRYDLGFDYALSFHHEPTPHEVCHKHAVKPPMHPLWSWLHDAHYAGKRHIDGLTYDEWRHSAGGVTFAVAVAENHANRPVYYYRGTSTHKFEVHFISYETRQPNSTWFNVPKACANATEEVPEESTGYVVPAVAGKAEPSRPVISETFEAIGSSHHVGHNTSVWGFGRWAVDQPKGHGLENWEYEQHAHHHHIHFLERYDLGKDFAITRDQHHHHVCHSRDVKPPMPQHWGWLKDAHYIGKHHIGEHIYDQWQWKNAGVNLTVSVSEHEPNRPFYFRRRTGTEHFEIHFLQFEAKTPNASWFDVPHECKNGTELSDITAPEKDIPAVNIGGSMNGVCRSAVEFANKMTQNNCPYIFGASGPCEAGFDNDGLVAAAFAHAGVSIPRLATEQMENGSGCVGGVQAGDLLFPGAGHVVMYMGNGMVAEAPQSGANARVSSFNVFAFNGICRRYC